MPQLTLRFDDDLVGQLKLAAGRAGVSVNRYAGDVLRAAVDPELEGVEAERVRARLRRAGLLVEFEPRSSPTPDEPELVAARAEAGIGTSLAALVAEGRS